MADPLARPWSTAFVRSWTQVVAQRLDLAVRDGWARQPLHPWRVSWVRGPLLSYADATVADAGDFAAGAPGGGRRAVVRVIGDRDMPVAAGQPVVMRLDLAGRDSEAIFRGDLASGCRNRLRKAWKSGLTCQWAVSAREMDAAWAVLSAVHARHGTPLFGRALLQDLLGSGLAEVAVAWQGETAVAMLVYVSDGQVAWIPWCGAVQHAHAWAPNHLTHWWAIERAVQQGCRVFDFGRSPYAGGTYEFKRKWGTQPRPLLTHTPEGPRPLQVGYRQAALFARAWRQIPAPIASALGRHVVRAVAL